MFYEFSWEKNNRALNNLIYWKFKFSLPNLQLKHMADEAGMHYYDENDLRRLGYDKTPDIKMILPFLYKGEVINWIESKADFGDINTHKFNIKRQLSPYCNR